MLQRHNLLKIAQAKYGRLASVPGEADHRARGCIYMLDYILLKYLVRHMGRLTISIEAFLLQIIANPTKHAFSYERSIGELNLPLNPKSFSGTNFIFNPLLFPNKKRALRRITFGDNLQ